MVRSVAAAEELECGREVRVGNVVAALFALEGAEVVVNDPDFGMTWPTSSLFDRERPFVVLLREDGIVLLFECAQVLVHHSYFVVTRSVCSFQLSQGSEKQGSRFVIPALSGEGGTQDHLIACHDLRSRPGGTTSVNRSTCMRLGSDEVASSERQAPQIVRHDRVELHR